MTRTTLRGSYRAKQRRTQHASLWKKLNRERQFSKIQGYAFALLVLVLAGSIGTYAISTGPLFHQIVQGNPRCEVFFNRPQLSCDARTNLYVNTDPSGSLSGFNTFAPNSVGACGNANSGCVTYLSVCAGGVSCFEMAGNSSHTALAQVSTPIPAIDLTNGKTLGFQFNWKFNGQSPRQFSHFGYYLTTNNTLPTVAGYDPSNDKSVSFLHLFEVEDAACTTPCSVFAGDFVLRAIGKGDTIHSEDAKCGLGPRLMCITHSIDTGVWIDSLQYFNSTGTNGGSPCTPIAGQVPGNGAGCSWDKNAALTDTSTGVWASTNIHPQFPTSNQYYLVFFVGPNMNNGAQINILWSFEQGTNAHDVSTFNNVAISPTIDTGGFFGPIVRALIAIGVFIVSNIILFLNYLYGLIVPLLAGLATILGGFLETIINAFGSIFGDNTLGTQVHTAFSQILAYLTQIFASAVAIWGNIITTLLRFLTFITGFFGSNPFITFIENFLAQAPNFWTVLNGVWADIMQYYISGVFTIQTILVFWYLFGMYEVYMHGLSGFKSWLQTSEIGFFGIFKAGYWLIDEAYGFIVQLKQLIFGNTVSPVKVAGTG